MEVAERDTSVSTIIRAYRSLPRYPGRSRTTRAGHAEVVMGGEQTLDALLIHYLSYQQYLSPHRYRLGPFPNTPVLLRHHHRC